VLSQLYSRGWLAKYRPAIRHGPHSNDACERYLRYLRAKQWHLVLIVGGIPLLIQVALFLFAVGRVILAVTDNLGIGIILFVLTITATALYYFSALLLTPQAVPSRHLCRTSSQAWPRILDILI
jgi:hypothetical protein